VSGFKLAAVEEVAERGISRTWCQEREDGRAGAPVEALGRRSVLAGDNGIQDGQWISRGICREI